MVTKILYFSLSIFQRNNYKSNCKIEPINGFKGWLTTFINYMFEEKLSEVNLKVIYQVISKRD